MTGAFALALVASTLTLSLMARGIERTWTRLIRVETEAIATLEELIRAQNDFARQVAPDDRQAVEKYRRVEQLLDSPALKEIDVARLRERVAAYRSRLQATSLRVQRVRRAVALRELQASSARVSAEAQKVIRTRKEEINSSVPDLQRRTRAMMVSGLAIAWIIVLLYLAGAKQFFSKVVQPITRLAETATHIRHGDLSAKALIEGDEEVARLAGALNAMADDLKERARTDELTSLPNFRAFRERIDDEISRSNRYGYEFGILVLDLDRFKKYNDTYGHLAGNDALRRVSNVIREAVRAVDFAARYGGEEFAVIAPQIDPASLRAVAERIRSHVEALPAPPDGAALTLSIGAAIYPGDGANPEALFHAADERLYQAKREGRNRVVVVTPPRVVQSAG